MTSTDDTTDVTSLAATCVEYLELKSEGSLGPDGMPSDDCAARWDDNVNNTSRSTHALLIGVLCPFYRDIGHHQRPMANYPMSNDIIIPPNPCIGSIYQHPAIVSSGFIPPVQRHPNRRKDTFNNVTDEDESSGSGDERVRSVSGDSFTSPSSRPPEEMGLLRLPQHPQFPPVVVVHLNQFQQNPNAHLISWVQSSTSTSI